MQTFCGECGGTMQMGYIVDRADYSVLRPACWVEGVPEPVSSGLPDAGLNVHNRAQYAVLTLRCERCGLLKSYARVGNGRG
jgi:hypothetical protein